MLPILEQLPVDVSNQVAEPAGSYISSRVEVDQSGKIAESHDTILAFANGEEYAIRLPSRIKRDILAMLKARGWSKQRSVIWLFSATLYFLLRDKWDRLADVLIDQEYPGYDDQIRNQVLRFAAKNKLTITNRHLMFGMIGKQSPAHRKAICVFRKQQKENRILKLSEILALQD